MNIPKKIKIGCYDYKVNMTAKNLLLNNVLCYGLIDYDFHTIEINSKEQDEQGQFQTFLHELMHAIVRDKNLALEDEELVVDEISKGLYEILKNNRNLFKDL